MSHQPEQLHVCWGGKSKNFNKSSPTGVCGNECESLRYQKVQHLLQGCVSLWWISQRESCWTSHRMLQDLACTKALPGTRICKEASAAHEEVPHQSEIPRTSVCNGT